MAAATGPHLDSLLPVTLQLNLNQSFLWASVSQIKRSIRIRLGFETMPWDLYREYICHRAWATQKTVLGLLSFQHRQLCASVSWALDSCLPQTFKGNEERHLKFPCKQHKNYQSWVQHPSWQNHFFKKYPRGWTYLSKTALPVLWKSIRVIQQTEEVCFFFQ